MWEAFSHNLKDPAGAAVPFFLLFMLIEMAAVRREDREDRERAAEASPRATSWSRATSSPTPVPA